jgi:hypothetical protein
MSYSTVCFQLQELHTHTRNTPNQNTSYTIYTGHYNIFTHLIIRPVVQITLLIIQWVLYTRRQFCFIFSNLYDYIPDFQNHVMHY